VGAPKPCEKSAGALCRVVRELGHVARDAAWKFGEDGCSLMAAATAFYGLISLFPLGALAVSVLGRVLKSMAVSDSEGQVIALLRSALPLDAPAIEQAIRQFPRPTGSWFVEAVSLLGLLWAASRLFHTLEDVLTRVWSGHGRGRPLFLRNLIALAATAGAGLIFLFILTTTTTAAAVASRVDQGPEYPLIRWLASWVTAVALPAGAWLMFLLMYVFLPQERVRWDTAAVAAAVAAVMWEVSRVGFGVLVTQSASYGKLYGSLAGTVLVGIWIYLTAAIMLIGAELAVVLQKRYASAAR
jgi:membrane protein